MQTQQQLDAILPGAVVPFVTCEGCRLFEAKVSDTEATFTKIADGKAWGDGESISGSGSSLDATAKIRSELPALLAQINATSLLDIPCGDHNWMQRTELLGIEYIGADVVRRIVETNRERFPTRRFEHLDLITDPLPDTSAILVRDCLVHLSYRQIGDALQNICNTKADWLIATHFPGRTNHNISAGGWRPLDLTARPFHLPAPSFVINEGCTEGRGQYADKSLGFWRIDDIRHAVQKMNRGPSLTIGMPTYRDWQGVWATVESILIHHVECIDEIEFVVIDNDPNGKPESHSEEDHSSKCKRLMAFVEGKYEQFTTTIGTAAAKGRIFELATAPAVLVVDCHVMFPTGTIRRLIDWTIDHRDSKDLWQGPLFCAGQVHSTHFTPKWGSLMYGQWGTDHQKLKAGEPFEILMQGCGMFCCNRSAWPGFHPLLRGFGPEEFHLHQRFRRNGGKCYCLPWLKWSHRFGNPGGAKPPGLAPVDRLRGHLITHFDTGQPPIESIRQHFVDDAKVVQASVFENVKASVSREMAGNRRMASAAADTVPPMLIRGWNFATAMARWTAAGMPRRNQTEIEDRLAICHTCEFLKNSQCTQCGCTCIEKNQILNKLTLATEKCPLGKWQ